MKRYIKSALLAIVAVVAFASCSKEESTSTSAGAPLVITPYFQGNDTRAVNYSISDYFELGSYNKATVKVNGTEYTFEYSDGVLRHSGSSINFPTDGSSIANLQVQWPEMSVRASTFPKNQESFETFLSSDWLSAVMTNVAPTTMLPVQLTHENAKVAFLLTNGQRIESLTINGYNAYCDPTKNEAQLLLQPESTPANMPIKSGQLGQLKISGEAGPRSFTLTGCPSTLVSGNNYTINLNVQ